MFYACVSKKERKKLSLWFPLQTTQQRGSLTNRDTHLPASARFPSPNEPRAVQQQAVCPAERLSFRSRASSVSSATCRPVARPVQALPLSASGCDHIFASWPPIAKQTMVSRLCFFSSFLRFDWCGFQEGLRFAHVVRLFEGYIDTRFAGPRNTCKQSCKHGQILIHTHVQTYRIALTSSMDWQKRIVFVAATKIVSQK